MALRTSTTEQLFRRFNRANPDIRRLFRRYARQMLRESRWKGDSSNVLLVAFRVVWHLRMKGDRRKIGPGYARLYAVALAERKPCYVKLFALGKPIKRLNGEQRRLLTLLRDSEVDSRTLVLRVGQKYTGVISQLRFAGFVFSSRPRRGTWWYGIESVPDWFDWDSVRDAV